MEALIISQTATTPLIDFNPSNGRFYVTGRSTPEHPSEYYSKVNTWVDDYIKRPSKVTFVEIYFEYFNTSSSKCILDLLKKIVSIRQRGYAVHFTWYYEDEDEDMKDAGMDFGELLKVPFDVIVKPHLLTKY